MRPRTRLLTALLMSLGLILVIGVNLTAHAYESGSTSPSIDVSGWFDIEHVKQWLINALDWLAHAVVWLFKGLSVLTVKIIEFVAQILIFITKALAVFVKKIIELVKQD